MKKPLTAILKIEGIKTFADGQEQEVTVQVPHVIMNTFLHHVEGIRYHNQPNVPINFTGVRVYFYQPKTNSAYWQFIAYNEESCLFLDLSIRHIDPCKYQIRFHTVDPIADKNNIEEKFIQR